jgi:hypothetical protein
VGGRERNKERRWKPVGRIIDAEIDFNFEENHDRVHLGMDAEVNNGRDRRATIG